MDFWTFFIMFLSMLSVTCAVSYIQGKSYRDTVKLLLEQNLVLSGRGPSVTKPRNPDVVAEEREQAKEKGLERKKRLLA